jgi:O-antigen/teichoic acid export membrane protein
VSDSSLRRLLQNSSALRTAAVYGLGGVAYALGNLLLARALPPVQFGIFTLFVAVVQVGAFLAPIGLTGQVNRRPGGLVPLGRPLLTSGIVAVATALIAWALYRMGAGLLFALVIGITAGGVSHVAAAILQSQLRFGLSLALSQGFSAVLLGMGAVAVIAGGIEPQYLAALVAVYYVISASLGWGILARTKPRGPTQVHSIMEGLSLLGITAAALVLMQLERLMTPRLLTLEDLATFAVVAAFIGSPFRMLQMGAGYTLVPRLSKASTQEERRQLVRREAVAIMFIGCAAALLAWFAAPWVAEWLLAGKYDLSAALMLAALLSAVVKLADGFATTTVWALASARQLAMLNWVSWSCAGVGIAGAWVGARWGLIGLMYGVTLGWVSRGAVAGALAAKLLRRLPAAHPAPQEVGPLLTVPNPMRSASDDRSRP